MNYRLFLLCLASCASLFAQYGGPSVLSRGTALTDEKKGLPFGFDYFGGISGVYDSGLTPVAVDATGNIVEVRSLYGVEANLGATGTRRWAHSTIGLSYSGNYRHYSSNTYYDGSDHTIGLDGRTNLTNHLSLVSRNGAGSVARPVAGFGGFASTPDALLGLTNNEIFDNRTYFLQTLDEIEWQKSARLSLTAGGDGFFVRRQSKVLVGTDGYGAHSTVAYRRSRKDTFDGAYSWIHFDYPRVFGESDIHQFSLGYSRTLSRTWQMSVLGGTYRVETIGTQPVPTDPITRALFGQTSTIVAYHAVQYLGLFSGQISGRFKRTSISMSYSRRPSPGNGVYLTSSSESGIASLYYTGTSRLSMGVSGGYTRMTSIGQVGLGNYTSAMGGFNANYRLFRNVHASLNFDARQLQLDTQTGFQRFGSRTTLSLNYSPGEKPLRTFH